MRRDQLTALPSTREELKATAPKHRERIKRVDRLLKLFEDYRKQDAALRRLQTR